MPRKVALISDHASPLATLGGVDNGGQNVYVNELSKELAKQGCKLDIFTRWADSRLPKIIDWREGVRVIHIPAGPVKFMEKEKMFFHMEEFTENLSAFIESEFIPYDILHANFWLSGMAALQIKKELRVPFVITFHALGKIRRLYQKEADKFPLEREKIEEEIVRLSDGIIAECPQDREDLINFYKADQKKIFIIPCGTNLEYFHSVDKNLAKIVIGSPQEEKIVLQVGRLVPRKGIETSLFAIKILLKRYKKKIKMLVVGGESDFPDPEKTPEIGRLQDIARRLKISERVFFAGRKRQDELKYYYGSADVFVSTPWYEPFGMTPLEAMACGVPVVGSAVGGIKFTVSNSETGYLVPPRDPESLAMRINDLLCHENLCKYFSFQGQKKVKNNFTWPKVADSILNLYEKVLSRERSGEDKYSEKMAILENSFSDFLSVLADSKANLRFFLLNAAINISSALKKGGKILICGNGGSAAESQHFACELMGRFVEKERGPLPVLALTADTAFLTACSNDFNYADIFSRQIRALARPEDVLVVLTTSGKSANILNALREAKRKGILTIGLLGGTGGDAKDFLDIPLLVPSFNAQRIQEIHLHLIHCICEIVDRDNLSQRQDEEKKYFYLKEKIKIV